MTPQSVAHQALLSVGFSRQEYWSELPCPPPRDLPNPGIELVSLMSLELEGRSFIPSIAWEAFFHNTGSTKEVGVVGGKAWGPLKQGLKVELSWFSLWFMSQWKRLQVWKEFPMSQRGSGESGKYGSRSGFVDSAGYRMSQSAWALHFLGTKAANYNDLSRESQYEPLW